MQELPSGKQQDFKLLLYEVIKNIGPQTICQIYNIATCRNRSVGEPPSKRPRMDPTLTGGIADIVNDKVTEVSAMYSSRIVLLKLF